MIDLNITNKLNSTEKKVLDIIRRVIKNHAPNTTVRLCGGWVRDKLLNKPSDDMDFMVDNMSGEQFANLVTKEIGDSKAPHTIRKNPEKTKNIEASKIYIPIDNEMVELDFVQARTEEYGENRREVTIKPSSAQEDAMRRDLTIGALFYNVNNNEIEDFTGKGIYDLITGTIRTPHDTGEPDSLENVKSTFIEDPLRVFRTIRFAAKYNWKISPITWDALQSNEVINAIFFSERKIATERIGQEFKKMIKGPNPQIAVKLLKDSGLFQLMLNEAVKASDYDGKMEPLDMDQNNPHHELTVWGHTYQVLINFLEKFPQTDPEKKMIMVMAILTHDLGKLYRDIQTPSKSHDGRTSYIGHEKASKHLAQLLMNYLKFESKAINEASAIARYHMQPHNFDEYKMSALRKFIRRMTENSINWLDVFNMAVADASAKSNKIDESVVEKYEGYRQRLNEALSSMSVSDNAKSITPILNGNEIMLALNIKAGSQMKHLTSYIQLLMDENPSISKDQAIEKLREFYIMASKKAQEKSISLDEALQQEIVAMDSVDNIDDVESNDIMSTASKKLHTTASECSVHLFSVKNKMIKDLLRSGNLLEAESIITDLVSQREAPFL
jgi:tRNA nucleotidyltransferase/poly(A) polymerase